MSYMTKIRILKLYYSKNESTIFFIATNHVQHHCEFWYECTTHASYAEMVRNLDKNVWWVIKYNELNYITEFRPVTEPDKKKASCILQ